MEEQFDAREMYEQLKNLQAKPSGEILFPPSLSSFQRKLVHQVADKLHLVHISINIDGQRCIKVKKGKNEKIKVNGPKYYKLPMGISEILDGFLYLGSGNDASDFAGLMEKGIDFILNTAQDWRNTYPEYFRYHNCHLKDEDDEDIFSCLEGAIDFIQQAEQEGKKVFVHCVVGKSRSASVVIAYLMNAKEMRLKEAFELVKSRRGIIQPNNGFMLKLLLYEHQLYSHLPSYLPSMVPGDWHAWSSQSSL
eukprot:CAMPEP_0174252506 /NCGR_PEP_ID=MMETSP0439-20130205/1950_1 /TAXON_ID=0 /ORGANISM="Stereomyxa ramosa, Strain Chinc5" /LENGTH=249 /DNA_ID=CAMNT_0015333053 /DNA_START=71 /DNA_END=817 /DNA_ORIENTATION=+